MDNSSLASMPLPVVVVFCVMFHFDFTRERLCIWAYIEIIVDKFITSLFPLDFVSPDFLFFSSFLLLPHGTLRTMQSFTIIYRHT